ncbi:uncharacterized protein EV154DRAFT_482996 [Mucor mucedo]|uniref:uncharacterized protein n=1 Tax=Mucor mucedo TaxID=29922 RepID=UPI0022206C5E|nr:uncharacterized protein EV154DRAFT_482996 [Mucor mucedo]KAI7889555.1 hypothetical protein EV154DRAFT_482996 [Mucor mucedo]
MYVDEPMNQWLGNGMEYKTVADNITYIMMRMDFCGDPLQRRPRPIEDRSIVATVTRLTEPWYHSGRVIIADFWFAYGSWIAFHHASMQETLLAQRYANNGHSPVAYAKYGSSLFMKPIVPGEHLSVGAFRDLKVKALVSNCSTTTNGNIRRFVDPVCGNRTFKNLR